jgi:hypothetical protein
MIQMLRKEACSGAIDDLAHVRTEFCLADCLTKHSAKRDVLVKAVETGVLPQVDVHPLFRTTLQHKAYSTEQQPTRDYWRTEGNRIIREHVQPRRALFVPQRDTCPVDPDLLKPCRETQLMTVHGNQLSMTDQWNDVGAALLSDQWTGRTVFCVSKRN